LGVAKRSYEAGSGLVMGIWKVLVTQGRQLPVVQWAASLLSSFWFGFNQAFLVEFRKVLAHPHSCDSQLFCQYFYRLRATHLEASEDRLL
jgi:hypothetical protein